MVWNWLRRHPRLVDGVVVVAFGAVYVAHAAHHHRYVLGIPLALLQTLPLLWRRRRPVAVLGAVTAGALCSALVYELLIPLAPAYAVGTVAARTSRRRSIWAGGLALAAIVAAAIVSADYPSLILFAAAWVAGDSIRTRRAYLAELEEKADRLEREREANVKRAAAEEQARISRELHDVIAHNVSVMTVQAAAARDVFERHPERAREALGSIESTGRAALTELRRLLGAIRTGDGPDLTPQPGLDRLEHLVAQVRSAGLDVDVTVEGERRPLPAAVDLSAYRIVQEALTNVRRHAGTATATVHLAYAPGELTVRVDDDGAGNGGAAAEPGGGNGIPGMRERAAALGGTRVAGPRPGGGFRVEARLPVGQDDAS
jgi:signal transduction histidine kinase